MATMVINMQDNWDALNLKELIRGAQTAVTRGRFVFLAINIAGILMLAEIFNTHFLWIRHTIDRREKKLNEFTDKHPPSATNIASIASSTNEPKLWADVPVYID